MRRSLTDTNDVKISHIDYAGTSTLLYLYSDSGKAGGALAINKNDEFIYSDSIVFACEVWHS